MLEKIYYVCNIYPFYRGVQIHNDINGGYYANVHGESFYGKVEIKAGSKKALCEKLDKIAIDKYNQAKEKMQLFCIGSANWDYFFYFDEKGKAVFVAVPKMDQLSCGRSYFGDFKHMMKYIDKQEVETITPAGKALIKSNGMKENYLHIAV